MFPGGRRPPAGEGFVSGAVSAAFMGNAISGKIRREGNFLPVSRLVSCVGLTRGGPLAPCCCLCPCFLSRSSLRVQSDHSHQTVQRGNVFTCVHFRNTKSKSCGSCEQKWAACKLPGLKTTCKVVCKRRTCVFW